MSPQGCETCCEPTLAGGHDMLAYPAAAYKKQPVSNGIAKERVPTATVNASKAPPQDLVEALRVHPKHIPCRFLYDDVGSQLYEQITQLKEYYPYETERALLKAHAKDIVRSIPPGSVVTELGVGDGSKTSLLLEALLDRDGPEAVHFCGIDCSAEALSQCRANLQRHSPRLSPDSLELIEAEYLAGVAEVRRRHPTATLCLLWLGSSVGNFAQDAAASLLHDLAAAAGGSMQLLLCTDLWKDRQVLHDAYNDSQGVTEAFIKNGMRHALRTLGQPEALAGKENWTYDCVVNPEEKQVEMWLVAHRAVPGLLPGSKVGIAAGERVLMEVSRKFTEPCIADLAFRAGLCIQAAWGNPLYRMTLLLPPREALQRCWADSDSLFDCIADWTAQPIGLRHPFCFYYGHNAAFTKLKLLPGEDASSLDLMLSRGIDPNVLDPSLCHSHPDVPDAWPSKEQLLEYVSQTRAKVVGSLEQLQQAPSSSQVSAPGMAELCMGLEHERMHQETLCYMMAQQRKRDFAEALQGSHKACIVVRDQPRSDVAAGQQAQRGQQQPSGLYGGSRQALHGSDVQPYYLLQASYLETAVGEEGRSSGRAESPPAVPATPKGTPDRAAGRPGLGSLGEADESSGDEQACEGDKLMVRVPGTKVQLGLGVSGRCGYVWDNELGHREVVVAPFLLASHPVTVGQFRDFILEHKGYQRPELWDPVDYRVLAASGQSMPATWSHDSSGDFVVHLPEASYPWRQVASCPAYVSLAEAFAYSRSQGARLLSEAEYAAACQHADSQAMAEGGCGGTQVSCGRLLGLREGGWEWTASLLEPFEGFQANPGYPEYSTDFFDGCHFVLKGSGPYTHPSMRRDSFRNFYQRQYPYVLAKFRLARDCE